jgi:hypothetical protein
MKTNPSYLSVFGALILAAVVSIPLIAKSLSKASSFSFEITLQSSAQGYAQIFYDIGGGFRETDSARVPIAKSSVPTVNRFPIPNGNYRALRFDPIDREASVTFSGVKILDSSGKVIKFFSASQFRAGNQISSLKTDGESVQMTTVAGAYDPILDIALDAPFSLKKADRGQMLAKMGGMFLVIFVPCWGLLWLAEMFYMRRRKRVTAVWKQLIMWVNDHPKSSIVGMAVFAVVLSCYPVVFFGKSFVSPNNATNLLYESFPTLPGYEDISLEDAKGSDVGAIMWQQIPYSIIQSRAIFKDFELPLWNRYNSNGVTLLGQGQSMFGDPLHVIVMLAGGASSAWDIKYLLAKMLFAAGLGLTVYAATRHLPSSLILAFSSAFIGFFSFRFNHPAFFSMCYAPWILYCWLRILQTPKAKASTLWTGGLILANWTVMNSGTAKEAYMLLVSLNLCGLLVFLLSPEDKRLKLRKFLYLVWAELLFALISTPVWLTFLDALKQSYTTSNMPHVWQIQPSLLIGLFDDIFYRQFNDKEAVFNPSVNFLILLGFLWSLTRFKELLSNHTYRTVGLSALIPFSLAFGFVPASVIVKVPYLANVAQVDYTFSCVLVIHLIVLAGFGLKACLERLAGEEWTTDFVAVVLMLFALLAFYFGFTHAAQRSSVNFLSLGKEIPKSVFFYVYGFSLVCAFVALPFIIKRITVRRAMTPMTALIALLFVGFVMLHWRHGMHLKTGFDDYVMNPQVRVNLQAHSPAIESIKSDATQPFRAVGFGGNLFPGYNAALGIESINGPDALINPYYRELSELSAVERVWDWRYIIREETLAKLKPFYNFLNIRYYLASHTEKPKELQGLEFTNSMDLNVYQSHSNWPRAFFTDALSSYKAPGEFVDMVREGDGFPFAAIQGSELARNPALTSLLRDQRQHHVVPATDYKLTNNTTSFTTVAPSKGVIVLTEAYLEKDFRVTVNGKPAHYFRVNHAFKGVEVTVPGTYSVSFSYWPRHFTLSLWVSGAGLFLLFIWIGYSWQAGAKKREAFVNKPLT